MERDRGADNSKRQIRRDTTQRPLASIFDPSPQDQLGEERRPRNRGTLRRPSRASKEFGPSTHNSPLPKNLNRSESGARRELGLGGEWGRGAAKLSSGIETSFPKCLLPERWEGGALSAAPFFGTNC